MIGSGLKKLAQEHNMTVSHGVAYGSLNGFAATLSEGAGYKQINFSTTFPDPIKKDAFTHQVSQVNIEKIYRVQQMQLSDRAVQVVFLDNPGTMKKIYEFLDWFIPLLRENGAAGAHICPACSGEVTGGKWLLIDGTAHHLHDSCATRIQQAVEASNTARKEADDGSYLKGFLGALIGATLGAVLWAVVLRLGYVASLVGLAIGWLSEKGYTLFHGKRGKGKLIILIVMVIFGVLLGNFAADAFTLVQMIGNGELPGFTYGDIPGMILMLLAEDADYASATMSNILLGLLFAALGVFSLLRKTGKEVADTKCIPLN